MSISSRHDVLGLNLEAVRRSIVIVAAVTTDQLQQPTPCGSWTVGDLLAHMTVQHLGFAAAATGTRSELADWEPVELGDRASLAYVEAAEKVIGAFGAEGTLGRSFWLPEIRDGGPFPAQRAIGFHFLDAVVHGWDVAGSLGVKADYPAELVHAALVVARQMPGGSARTGAKAAFRSALQANPRQSEMDQLLLTLGRSPSWPNPS